MAQPVAAPVEGERAVDHAVNRAFRLPAGVVAVGLLALLAVALFSATRGAAELPATGVLTAVLDRVPFLGVDSTLSDRQEGILFEIRLPRMVLGMLVGGSLGMAGAAYQGVFRNPLADPYLLGVSAGAGFGAVLALGFGVDVGWGPFDAVSAAAFLGALIAVAMSTVIARGPGASPATLLLGGVAMAALFSAAQTFALQRLRETRAREVLSWLFGQLNTSGWDQVWILGPYVIVCGGILIVHRRHLDVLRVGDAEAVGLGLDPARVRLVIVVTASLLTAAAVSVSGLIAFVGLVVPHIVRLLVGSSYRVIVPLSALFGAAFLGFVDVGARTLLSPAELPVGVITAFVGAPFFAFILWRGKGRDVTATALSCREVRVAFGSRVAVDGVSLDVTPGEWLGILGPNGAGKSSLLGAIAGLHEFEGMVSCRADEPLTRRDVALVPQSPMMPEGMTVAEYVLLGRTAHLGWFAHETAHDRDIVCSVLTRLRLGDFATRPVTELSGGEQQRVVVARALAHGAPVLLLDEPTTALDLGHQSAVLELVDRLRREEALTVVAAMHDLTTATRFVDRLALINRGRVIVVGPPRYVLQAELLSEVYETPLTVEQVNGELVVLPAPRRAP